MSDISTIPADAGLKPGQEPPEPRLGDDLIDAAAAGASLSERESNDLLAYYLTNGGMPGDNDTTPLSVKLGHGDRSREFRCDVKRIEWGEWQDARDRATNQQTDEFDTFVSASWVVARALVTPKLGPVVARMQQEDPEKAPSDAAALLRRMFRKQSGALLELSAKVLELSKLSSAGEQAVKEVDAGKP